MLQPLHSLKRLVLLVLFLAHSKFNVAFAERFVLSIRKECLDRMVPLSEAHLRRSVSEYLRHYHVERNQQGIGNELIEA